MEARICLSSRFIATFLLHSVPGKDASPRRTTGRCVAASLQHSIPGENDRSAEGVRGQPWHRDGPTNLERDVDEDHLDGRKTGYFIIFFFLHEMSQDETLSELPKPKAIFSSQLKLKQWRFSKNSKKEKKKKLNKKSQGKHTKFVIKKILQIGRTNLGNNYTILSL